jgi:hypothetical protein
LQRSCRFFYYSDVNPGQFNLKRFVRSDVDRLRVLFWWQRSWRQGLTLFLLLLFAACGYRVIGSVQNLPGGVHSIGIPTFKNRTREYKLEEPITAAVLKEFTLRTRIPVSSRSSGVDAVLEGEIRNLSSTPVTFGTDAFGSAFDVTVQMSVKLVRVKDGIVVWENPDFTFRGHYVLSSKVTEFFSEENAAVNRLAREFAASLASIILTR